MTNQEQLADFLARRIAWARSAGPYWMASRWVAFQERPTAEKLARELLQDAEFRALRLGTWLGTADGAFIAQAVESVAPPFYRQDVELLVEALILAAAMQQTEGQSRAGAFALGVIGVATLIAIGLGEMGEGRAA